VYPLNIATQHLPRRARRDLERLEKKRIKGHIYYYDSKGGRVNGKCRRLWQTYLGKPEDILHTVEGGGPRPPCAEVFHVGLAATCWQECQRANLSGHIDRHCPKREQGVSPGESLALAALNRASHPLSTSAMVDWCATTTLRRHFPHASKAAFASQRFWDHRARRTPAMTLAIWKAIIPEVIEREAMPLSSVCDDGTNFSTCIDPVTTQCQIAKRGKNTPGRSHVRQVSSALLCHADAQVPLYDEVYEGTRHDPKPCPVMIQKLHDCLTTSFGGHLDAPQVTLLFAKGHNSQENFRGIGTLKLHSVGSIQLCEVKELAEISPQDPRWTPCQTSG